MDRTNDRFGTSATEIVSQLEENSPAWGTWTPKEKQKIIDAARTVLLYDNPGGLLSAVHGGDAIFKPGDMTRWLDDSLDLDGEVGAFNQNPNSASSPFNAALDARILEEAARRDYPPVQAGGTTTTGATRHRT